MGTTRPHIVLFGDSITEKAAEVGENTGWAASLTNHYNRKADVVLRGFAGYNTRLALMLLDGVFPIPSSNPPLVVTVFFGANDAAIKDSAHGIVHVPLEEYRKNTHAILAHLKKQSDSTKIILISPPPLSEKMHLKYAVTLYEDTSGVITRRNEVTKLYAEECKKVGKEANVRVIDLWPSLQEAPDWEDKYYRFRNEIVFGSRSLQGLQGSFLKRNIKCCAEVSQRCQHQLKDGFVAHFIIDISSWAFDWGSDGLHFTAQGNAIIFKELVKVLDEPGFVPTLKADQMPWDYPPWTEFGEDPEAAVRGWGTPK